MSAIVFLPGLPLGPALFDEQAAALRADGHDVLQLVYPGFDGGDVPAGLDFAAYVDDAQAQVAAFGDRPRILVGLSFGAQLALSIAARAPELVEAVVVSNTQGGAQVADESGMFEQAAGAADAHGTAALTEMLSGLLLSEETKTGRPEVVARLGELIAATPGPAAASAFRALAARPDPASFLAGVTAPVTLVFGTGDGATSVADADALATGLANAESAHIDGAGHFPPLETPDQYLAALRGVLGALPA